MDTNPVTASQAAAQTSSEHDQYLTFMLGDEVFAIGILSIKEIIEYTEPTAVPMMPDCIRGVINLRGSVVPVMDLALRFGRGSREVSKRTCIVIVEVQRNGASEDVGVVVDAVNAVLDIDAEDIEAPPAFGTRVRSDFIRGLGKVSGKFVILLETDRVLAIEELAATADSAELALAGGSRLDH